VKESRTITEKGQVQEQTKRQKEGNETNRISDGANRPTEGNENHRIGEGGKEGDSELILSSVFQHTNKDLDQLKNE